MSRDTEINGGSRAPSPVATATGQTKPAKAIGESKPGELKTSEVAGIGVTTAGVKLDEPTLPRADAVT
ncbi:MAG TPA: hypothetical protein VFF39_15800, partial [Verrucomicrobiae bacterium]|nr:hypothetical protein [Verrucomicrobiae bacterium]